MVRTPPTGDEKVKAVQRGIRRTIGTAVDRKAPATAKAIKAMVTRIPDTLRGRRDRALLLTGFAAALRRSELVALDVEDLERTPDGVFVHIRRSKTDQEGEGHMVAVPRGGKLKPGPGHRGLAEQLGDHVGRAVPGDRQRWRHRR